MGSLLSRSGGFPPSHADLLSWISAHLLTCQVAALNFPRVPAGLRRRAEPRRLFRCWAGEGSLSNEAAGTHRGSRALPSASLAAESFLSLVLSLPTLLRNCFLSRGFKYKSALHAAAAAAATCSDPASLCMHGKANKQKKLATLLLITHPPLAGALRLIRSFSSFPLPLHWPRPFSLLRDPRLVGPLLKLPLSPSFVTISRKEAGRGLRGASGLLAFKA